MEFIPDEFSEEDKVTGMWWRQLVAGGLAGVGEDVCLLSAGSLSHCLIFNSEILLF